MKLNFKEVKMYTGIARKACFVTDLRETFADILYARSSGIAALELARKIYHSDGEEDYDQREVQLIRQVASQCTPQFIESMDEIMKNEDVRTA